MAGEASCRLNQVQSEDGGATNGWLSCGSSLEPSEPTVVLDDEGSRERAADLSTKAESERSESLPSDDD